MNRIPTPAFVFGSLAALLLLATAACSPFGTDDSGAQSENTPTATYEVVMSTFTATEVLEPADLTATAELAGTAAAEAATARAGQPTPTPAVATPDPEEVLNPPMARLQTANGPVESYLASYSWQFNDPLQTFAAIESAITQFERESASVGSGEALTISFHGEEYRTPPLELMIEVYDFDTNSAFPVGPTGEQGADLAFSIQNPPDQSLMADDPARPAFTIDVPPGHYAIRVQGHWGQHPALARPLFVTWVFDVEVV